MKNSSQKISRSSGLDRSPVGNRPGAAANIELPAVASAPSPAPTKPKLIVKNGAIAKISHKTRSTRVGVVLNERLRRLLVSSPLVNDEIHFQRRLIHLDVATVLMTTGLSLNRAARALGLSPSVLSSSLKLRRENGDEALRSRRWNAGRKTKSGRAARHDMFIDFITGR